MVLGMIQELNKIKNPNYSWLVQQNWKPLHRKPSPQNDACNVDAKSWEECNESKFIHLETLYYYLAFAGPLLLVT